ncbi:MAG: AAA family ATPase [Pseudoalteromonas prydzensis]|uniref:AAA family ATPase n=1 Tax=Pseudoalteromonas prydzensis TaxID=182141 RepID=UPI003F997ED3
MQNSQSHRVIAVYQPSTIPAYQGNPLIEALPPLNSFVDDLSALKGKLRCTPDDIHQNGVERAHSICRVIDDFFQPLSQHIQLHERISLMIRGGYVGRNPDTGDWARHIQNGYERVLSGDLKAIKFTEVYSTAQSMTLIGCSGNGKTTAMKQLLSLYPQVIYHPDTNLEQIIYLKIDCSHDGSLKELCLNFFRAIDRALGTSNYEKQYSMSKRPSIETLLAAMAQVANAHALGVLIIDEIQHLSRSRSGGSEKMLNFFVTLVNTIGLPVILVGTPRAREIFEADMRSARRGSGLGAIFWDPMEEGREWRALTDKLWSLQWLQKRDEILSDEIRNLWYDLSQGVLDIVVKLFVLCQLRAITTKVERITPKLMQQVHNDELIPVHPMLAALRSDDPEAIIKFSDLKLSDTDKRLLKLQQHVAESVQQTPEEFAYQQLRSEEERRVYIALKDDFDTSLLAPAIRKIFDQNPNLTWISLLPLIHAHLTSPEQALPKKEAKPSKGNKASSIKHTQWHTLDSNDLRFIHSQADVDSDMHSTMLKLGLVLNIQSLLEEVS